MASLVDKYSKGFMFYDGEERQLVWSAMLDLERDKYAELYSDYKTFLKACRELIKELSIDSSSLSKIKCIDMLASLGKFSYNGKFTHDTSPQKLIGIHGAYIVYGKGCCRHLSNFAKDLLRQGNTYCDKFYCNATYESIPESLDGDANHMINIIKYNDSYIGYDLANHEESYFVSPVHLKSVVSLVHLYYKPELQIVFDGLNIEGLESNLVRYSDSVGAFKLTEEELSDMSCEVSSKIISKKKVLKDFERSTNSIKEKIYKQIPR